MEDEILDEDTQKDKYLIFTLGQEHYGIDIRVVMEIIGILPITKVPEVPDYVRGIINLRGKIIPVVDIRLRFGREFRPYTDRTCIIVIEVEDVLIGLLIDGVSEVMTIPEGEILPPPELKSAQNRYIRSIGRLPGDHVVLLLDWEKLFSVEEEQLLSDMNESKETDAFAEGNAEATDRGLGE